jgi:hypothetical protein
LPPLLPLLRRKDVREAHKEITESAVDEKVGVETHLESVVVVVAG